MPSTAIHPNWKRERLTFEISETAIGWEVALIAENWKQSLEVLFATEEAATKAGQAILDYSYGPAGIDLSKVKVKPKDDDEKPKTRKAPGKRKSTKSESAGAAS